MHSIHTPATQIECCEPKTELVISVVFSVVFSDGNRRLGVGFLFAKNRPKPKAVLIQSCFPSVPYAVTPTYVYGNPVVCADIPSPQSTSIPNPRRPTFSTTN